MIWHQSFLFKLEMCVKVETEHIQWNILVLGLRTMALSWGFPKVESLKFQDDRKTKMLRLSAPHNVRLYPQEIFLVLISARGWVNPGMIMSMKNSFDTNGNRTRDLPTYNVVPEPIVPPRVPTSIEMWCSKKKNWEDQLDRLIQK